MFELSHVTNYVLYRAKQDNVKMTNMKLNKTLYFLYKAYLVDTGTSLFAERFEAWKYGPALNDVYQAFKKYEARPIKTYCTDSSGKLKMVGIGTDEQLDTAFAEIWPAVKNLTGSQLARITHTVGSAWYEAYTRYRQFLDDERIRSEPDYLSEKERLRLILAEA